VGSSHVLRSNSLCGFVLWAVGCVVLLLVGLLLLAALGLEVTRLFLLTELPLLVALACAVTRLFLLAELLLLAALAFAVTRLFGALFLVLTDFFAIFVSPN
jgi:hypothetical protein